VPSSAFSYIYSIEWGGYNMFFIMTSLTSTLLENGVGANDYRSTEELEIINFGHPPQPTFANVA
jgi:hypothetical protein